MTPTETAPFHAVESGPATGAGRTMIRTRLSLAFGIMFVLIVGLGGLALTQLNAVASVAQEMRQVALPKLVTLQELDSALNTHALLAERRVGTRDFRQLARIERDMRGQRQAFYTQMDRLGGLRLSPEEIALRESLTVGWASYLARLEEVAVLSEQGELDRAKVLFEEGAETAAAEMSLTLRGLLDRTRNEAQAISDLAGARFRQARLMTAAAILAGMAATLAAIVWVVRNVSNPLLRISGEMRRITHGAATEDAPALPPRCNEVAILSEAAAAFRDSVLESRALAQDLERQRALLDATVAHMPLGLCMFAVTGRVVVANAAFGAIFDLPEGTFSRGARQSAIIEHIATRLKDGREKPETVARWIGSIVRRQEQEVSTLTLDSGRSVSTIIHPTPDGWMMIAEDITERVKAEENIRFLARHDPLTGLPNRRSFSAEIDTELLEARADHPAAVMLLDLDRFKHVNDTFGHGAGDELLKQVADRLRWAVREGDTVARFGGDEFAVIQRGCAQPESAARLSTRIIELLSTPFELSDTTVQIGGSLGVALAPGDGDTAEEVMKNADTALYAVKGAGKGFFLYYNAAMKEREEAMMLLERDLRRALRDDAFVMHYQPMVDIASGQICGAEALLRWNHPERGIVPTGEFIDLAEELGLMRELGAQALQMACAEAAGWPAHLRVAVNLSPTQFRRGDVLGDVSAALAASGLAAERLEVEITEAPLLDDAAGARDALTALHEAGVRIVLDDFGTGYSSLKYLRSFPFDKVKIDASFVRDLQADEGARDIVRAICALCDSLGIRVTAEGIETEAQLATVAGDGCAEAQGYLLGRPQPAQDFLHRADTASPGHLGVAS